MKKLEAKTNVGYEITCYYPKQSGKYTENTGNVKYVYQTDDVAEVAAFFANEAWCSPYGDPNYANPTVTYNGKRWPESGWTATN